MIQELIWLLTEENLGYLRDLSRESRSSDLKDAMIWLLELNDIETEGHVKTIRRFHKKVIMVLC